MFLLIAFKIFLKDIKFPLKFCQDQLAPVHRIGIILIYKKLKPLMPLLSLALRVCPVPSPMDVSSPQFCTVFSLKL